MSVQHRDRPDLIVGIDFGQTCTGVAYSLAQASDSIRQIQRWPGVAHRNENKVPTILLYEHGSDRPSRWGFHAEGQDEGPECELRDWFKILLDPKILERRNKELPNEPIRHEDVRRWYRDFLSLLYEYIKQKLSAELPNFIFDTAKVEYLFSMPTTWGHDVVEMFRELVNQAGFSGPVEAQHSVTMSLTEAEAAAVHTSTEAAGIFQPEDILVVCDAGGGTTDLSALEVTQTMIDSLSLSQLKQVDIVGGESIGSVAVDIAFQSLAWGRLLDANGEKSLDIDTEEASWAMQKSKDFQNVKCEHGAPYETPRFLVPIPGISADYVNERARIANGHMQFDQSELQGLFDPQVDKLFQLIDKQLRKLAERMPGKQVKHLVLSGGLGQSAYVQHRLKRHYCNNNHLVNAQGIQVRVAPEPQMAVCKGLVADRLRKLKSGQSVLGWRCCRASYGLLCRELYDRRNPLHIGRKTLNDPTDGHLYVVDSVRWFVKKGEPVTIDQPIVHSFSRMIKPGDPRKIFPNRVVVSYAEKDTLPLHFEAGVEKLCEVEADLSVADERKFLSKNKRFWQPGEPHLVVVYEVKVIIGAADLQFELWFENQKMSKENSIKVEWAPSTDPSIAALQPADKFEDDGLRVTGADEKKKNGRSRFFHRS